MSGLTAAQDPDDAASFFCGIMARRAGKAALDQHASGDEAGNSMCLVGKVPRGPEVRRCLDGDAVVCATSAQGDANMHPSRL